jgi:hypothetical protein
MQTISPQSFPQSSASRASLAKPPHLIDLKMKEDGRVSIEPAASLEIARCDATDSARKTSSQTGKSLDANALFPAIGAAGKTA